MADEKTLRFLITAKADEAIQQFKASGEAAKEAGEKAHESGSGFEFVKKTIEALGLVEGAKKAIEFGKGLIEAGEGAEQSDARIKAIATSMGVFGSHAGEVTDRLAKMAQQTAINDGLDENSVKMTEAKLLTFKSLAKTAGEAGGMFDKVTQSAINMGAAGFGDAASNAKFLGRAMDDPVKGMTALTRVGVVFTAAEQKQIKTMVEHGHASEAQGVILDKLQQKFGGVAAATATSAGKMKASWEAVKEEAGKALLPTFEKVAGFITGKVLPAILGFVNGFEDGTGAGGKFHALLNDQIMPILKKVGDFIEGTAVPAIKNFIKGMQDGTGPGGQLRDVILDIYNGLKKTIDWANSNSAWLDPIAVGVATLVAAYKGYTLAMQGVKLVTDAFKLAQAALNVVMDANPFAAIALLLIGLGAALVYAYNHSATFRDICNSAFHAVGQAAQWMWNNAIAPALRFIINGFGDVLDFWARVLGALGHVPGFGWARDAANMMHGAATKAHELADGIHNIPNRTVSVNVNFSSNAWQIQQQVASAARLAAGITFGTSGSSGVRVSAHAMGGPIGSGELSLVGEQGPELFVPKSAGSILTATQTKRLMGGGSPVALGGGGGNVYITVQGDSDPLGAARRIHQRLIQYRRTELGGRGLNLG